MSVLVTCAPAANTIVEPVPLVYVALMLAALGAGAKLMMWIGGMNAHKAAVTEFMAEIRDDIKSILRRLSPVVASGSPLRLTDLGKAIAESLEASTWAERVAPGLETRAEGMPPYEIQDLCSDYVRKEAVFDEAQQAKIKESAYNNGLERDQVLDVLMVVLRDRLLASHES